MNKHLSLLHLAALWSCIATGRIGPLIGSSCDSILSKQEACEVCSSNKINTGSAHLRFLSQCLHPLLVIEWMYWLLKRKSRVLEVFTILIGSLHAKFNQNALLPHCDWKKEKKNQTSIPLFSAFLVLALDFSGDWHVQWCIQSCIVYNRGICAITKTRGTGFHSCYYWSQRP